MTDVSVPPELEAAFRDALTRPCLRCSHPVVAHLSGSSCECCCRGLKTPSVQVAEVMDALREVDAIAREARRRT